MYVCIGMIVCVYVYSYVCMYLNECMYVSIYACMNDEYMYACMHVCMYGWMDVGLGMHVVELTAISAQQRTLPFSLP